MKIKDIKKSWGKNKKKVYISLGVLAASVVIWHIGGREYFTEIFSSRAGGKAVNKITNADGTTSIAPPIDISKMRTSQTCLDYVPWGTHTLVDQAVVDRSLWICKASYASQYDPLVKFPIWISETVKKRNLVPFNVPASYTLMTDPTVPANMQPSVEIFNHLPKGYQIGLLASIPNRYLNNDALNVEKLEELNAQSIKEGFYTTNAYPVATNAKAIIDKIDQNIRALTDKRFELMTVSGLIYLNGQSIGTIQNGDEKLFIPTHIYKIVTHPATHASISYIIPNTNNLPCGNNCAVEQFTVPLLEVERVTGLEFYTKLAPFYAVQVKKDINQIFKDQK